MHRHRLVVRTAAFTAVLLVATVGAAQASQPATLATVTGATVAFDPVSASPPGGVSSFVITAADGTAWLYASNGPTGIEAHTAADGVSWAKTSVSGLSFGVSDISVIPIGGGRYRAYLAYMPPTQPGVAPTPTQGCQTKYLKTAVSSDLRSWTAEAGGSFDIGCGVPQAVTSPTGETYLYFVSDGRQGGHGSRLAVSTDGSNFAIRGGLLVGEDNVDPSVIRLADGSWLMAYATFPKMVNGAFTGDGFQHVGLAASADGITWQRSPTYILNVKNTSHFDPTLLLLPDGRIRMYYSEMIGTGNIMMGTPVIRSAMLTLKPGSAAPAAAAAKPATKAAAKKMLTITCVKGTTTAKVTGTNPKCPAGYKKK